jgi:5'-nucleotidase
MRVDPRAKAGSGKRIAQVDVLGNGGLYYPLETGRRYRVATNSFLARGGNGYEEFSRARAETSAGTAVRDIIMQQMSAQPRLALAADGRITVEPSSQER